MVREVEERGSVDEARDVLVERSLMCLCVFVYLYLCICICSLLLVLELFPLQVCPFDQRHPFVGQSQQSCSQRPCHPSE